MVMGDKVNWTITIEGTLYNTELRPHYFQRNYETGIWKAFDSVINALYLSDPTPTPGSSVRAKNWKYTFAGYLHQETRKSVMVQLDAEWFDTYLADGYSQSSFFKPCNISTLKKLLLYPMRNISTLVSLLVSATRPDYFSSQLRLRYVKRLRSITKSTLKHWDEKLVFNTSNIPSWLTTKWTRQQRLPIYLPIANAPHEVILRTTQMNSWLTSGNEAYGIGSLTFCTLLG